MQRFGRVVRLREGAEEEYERYHADVYPGVLESIRAAGICNYTIFRYGCWLFSYFELEDGANIEDVARTVGESEASRAWERIMQGLQEPLPESQGGNWWAPVKEVWHSDGSKESKV